MYHRTIIKQKCLYNNAKVQIRNHNLSSINNTQLICVIIDENLNGSDHIIFKKKLNLN